MAGGKQITVSVGDVYNLEGNVNEMSDAEFNALCEGIEETEFIPPILVVPHPEEEGKYVTPDGNHRLMAARLLGYEEVDAYLVDEGNEMDPKVLAARLNIVRGSPNKDRMTKLWHHVRKQADRRKAMHMLGITSESQLRKLVNTNVRKLDAGTVVKDEIQVLKQRAGIVQDLTVVLRAVIGDSDASGEFDYLAFQVRRANVVLVRVPPGGNKRLSAYLDLAEQFEMTPYDLVINALTALIDLPDEEEEE